MMVTYGRFRERLRQQGRTDAQVRHLYGAVRELCPKARRWFVRWFATGDLPADEVEGVTADFLVRECGCDEINALIMLDWLLEDPDAAKYWALSPRSAPVSEEAGRGVQRLLEREGRAPKERPALDTSPIQADPGTDGAEGARRR